MSIRVQRLLDQCAKYPSCCMHLCTVIVCNLKTTPEHFQAVVFLRVNLNLGTCNLSGEHLHYVSSKYRYFLSSVKVLIRHFCTKSNLNGLFGASRLRMAKYPAIDGEIAATFCSLRSIRLTSPLPASQEWKDLPQISVFTHLLSSQCAVRRGSGKEVKPTSLSNKFLIGHVHLSVSNINRKWRCSTLL